jgi:hypothetical protein
MAIAALGVLCTLFVGWAISRYPLDDPFNAASKLPADASAAQRYVAANPFDALGYVAWARELALDNRDLKKSGELIAVAKRLAPIDPQVMKADIEWRMQTGDVEAALTQAAELATISAVDRGDALAIIARSAGTPAWDAFVRTRIASSWPLLDALVRATCQQAVSLDKLLALAGASVRQTTLSEPSVKCVIDRAVERGQIRAAHWFWLNATPKLPQQIGFVFNGGFQAAPSTIPFDWKIEQGGQFRDGFSARIVGDSDRRNLALSVQFNGRPVRSAIARQMLALEPGEFRLSWSVREVSGPADNATRFRMLCVPGSREVMANNPTATPAADGWVRYAFDFSIPADCGGQQLLLERARDRGTAHPTTLQLFDDVEVRRR